MNRSKFIASWILIFGVVASFSVLSLARITSSHNKVYAAVVKDNQLHGNLVVIDNKLCEATPAQFSALQTLYGAEGQLVDLGNGLHQWVLVPKHNGINKGQLQKLLSQLNGSKCIVIPSHNFFYLFFQGGVS